MVVGGLEGVGGKNNCVGSELPPASCFVLVFSGVEITEMCVKPMCVKTGTLVLQPESVVEQRLFFLSQDEVLARHQKLSSVLQFNGATS